jgi:hypothetical protein
MERSLLPRRSLSRHLFGGFGANTQSPNGRFSRQNAQLVSTVLLEVFSPGTLNAFAMGSTIKTDLSRVWVLFMSHSAPSLAINHPMGKKSMCVPHHNKK